MRRLGKDAIGAGAALAILAAAPLVVSSTYFTGILAVSVIYGIWAASWDFMSGLTGRENFGHALFIGAGAYTAAFLNSKFDLSPWWGLPAGALVAVAFSLIIGFPTLRLRGPYFALAMLAAATIMQRLTRIFWQYTGGEEGIPGLDPLFNSPLATYYFCLGALVLTSAVLLLLARSSWGTILRAIRGDEAACQAAGIDVTYYKIAALMISAAFAGMGGALYADYQEAVTPDVFAVALSITIIIMVYVGGMGTIWGPVGGAILLAMLPELLRGLGEYRLWVYSLVLIFILFFSPGGLVAPLWQWLSGPRR
jgi:branched-chain amino acid transport system permease protein